MTFCLLGLFGNQQLKFLVYEILATLGGSCFHVANANSFLCFVLNCRECVCPLRTVVRAGIVVVEKCST